MSNLKELKTKLQKNGYAHQWKLIKQKDITSSKIEFRNQEDFHDKITRQTAKPPCQNIDLIIPSRSRTTNQQIQLEQFLNIIGTEIHEQASCFHGAATLDVQSGMQNALSKKVEMNEEKRRFRIQEFIKTEKSYVDTLRTIVNHVVKPLRATMQQKNCVLNTFKCQKIFLNIEQIMEVNSDFLADLTSSSDNFGEMCQNHITKFECYRKYLLEQSEAQKLHAKEYKTNQNYKRFLSKIKDHADFKRKRLQDILVEPVQRISRYSMMLREILQLTSKDHADYVGLFVACEKASEIATMADDDPTKTATMFLNLYQAIKDSPCSLINQKRSLIAHIDAIEIHRVTNKPTRAVSIFLFTDKILVASRSSIDSKEIDLQQLLDNSKGICPTNSSSASLLRSTNYSKSEKPHLKFKGWADVESIEMFEGVEERPGSFILSATNAPEPSTDHLSNITSFEKYFFKGPRLYSVLPARDETSFSKSKRVDYLDKLTAFRGVYHKTRALMKRYEPATDKAYYKMWKGIPSYCNVYDQDSYIRAKYKNDSAIIYVDDNDTNMDHLFATRNALYNPWIVGLIQPEDMKGFRFNICAKTNLLMTQQYKKSSEKTIDFESIFWNNMLYLDQCLKNLAEYSTQVNLKLQQNLQSQTSQQSTHHSTRSRSKTMPRTSSIPSLGKLFNSSNSSARSVSPSSIVKKSRSASYQLQHQSSSMSRISVHNSWSGSQGYYKNESHSQLSSVTTLASSLWSSSYGIPTSGMDDQSNESDIERDYKETNINIDQKQQQYQFEKPTKTVVSNTISSLNSDSSARSSFSMITDDDFGEEVGIDYMTLDVKDKQVSAAPTPVPTPPTDNNMASNRENLESMFKSLNGFEDEMQQQWKELVTKYEMLSEHVTNLN
ncbi:hypothetical protein [Parasitella parasitica]|uniref:DH domain-containing protein n=1 Tax=Parasitella parasitica TaxID=35722 RepID=A0A0B7N2A1_9FUNG|nr:hypothetical protein [Parasitella parasitica]